ncbi:MAG: endonuclease domain-containing protein [Chloroflexi bacterium]|nr:endonuclease domain-containing protein [Chloroflexota bacterium]MYF64462.1 endonuclease domain-containing protein [Chloroflexota bacterium]MYK35594.1 endonuclease domain-containing protein [Chloroflexota bacterium]
MDSIARSRELRSASTDAEQALWQRVRARQLGGYKFRRQVPIAWFIADLVCEEGKLIVELDGSQHQERTEADERRTRQIERHGYRVMRVWNNDVLKNIDGVLEALLAELQRGDGLNPSPPRGPSP